MQTAIDILQEIGIKATPQRMAIIDFLEKDYSHPTSEVIYSKVKEKYPTMSFATVYNTLEKLEAKRIIIKLSITGERSHYEYHTYPHCHFYCKKCKDIIDIPMTDNITPEALRDYKVEEVHGYFKGICPKCLNSD